MGNVRRSERAAVSVGSCAHDQVTGVLVEAWRRRIDHFDSTDHCFHTFFICCVLNHEVLGSLLKGGTGCLFGYQSERVKSDFKRRAMGLVGVFIEVVLGDQKVNLEKSLA
jgi:hypothetical protein